MSELAGSINLCALIHFPEKRARSSFYRVQKPADAAPFTSAGIGQGVPGEDQNFLDTLNPMMRGSRVKILVLKPVSSLLVKVLVIGVSLNRFLT